MSEILEGWWDKLVAGLGLKAEVEDSVIQEVEEQTEIPEDYQRRFDLYPVLDPKQLFGREEVLSQIKQAYENWKISSNPLLIVAEHGIGMSSLLNSGSGLLENVTIIENDINIGNRAKLLERIKESLKITEGNSLTQLVETIGEEKQVIVFENVERLFLRKVGGFGLLEDFLLFIHSTKNKIFWVVTINDYSYYYLNETRGFATNFLSTIRLKGLEEAFVDKCIMQRNEGYDIIYLKPEKSTKAFENALKEIDPSLRQEMLEQNYFKKLIAFAKGNVSIAFIYWLKSVKKMDAKTVYVKSFEPNPFSDLTLDELLTLEAIHQHSSLSSVELQQVLRNSGKIGQLTIEYLMERDLVFPIQYKDGKEEYKINLFHLHTVLSLFHSRLNRNYK